MNERHKYDYHVNLSDDNFAATKVLKMIGENKNVLEIGAGPGAITQHISNIPGCHVSAVELDSSALPLLKPFCQQVFQRNLNEANWHEGVNIAGGYDVIVAADVLEHLLDPWQTLASLKSLLSHDGHIIVSLPHAGHLGIIAALLNDDFRYHEWGLLDRTHIRFFCMNNVHDLFQGAGLSIIDTDHVIHSPMDMELAKYWKALPSQTKKCLNNSKNGHIYQFVIKATIVDSSISNTDATMPKNTQPKPAFFSRCLRLLRRTVRYIRSNF